MDLERVNPDIRADVAALRMPPLARPWGRGLARIAYALKPAVRTPGTRVTTIRNAVIRARVIRPERPRPVPTGAILWFHGGGFVIGTTKQDAALLGRAAAELGIPAFSVHYPLAPRAKLPDMLRVAHRAWSWLLDHAAELGIDPARIAVGGESAGAQIAADLVQVLKDEGGRQPAGQWLFAPAADDRILVRQPHETDEHFVIGARTLVDLIPQFTGHEAGSPDMPAYAFPNRRTDLRGLPPAWIYVGSIELFHDDVAVYADRLRAAGVSVDLHIVPGAVHGFEMLFPRSGLAQQLFATAIGWLRTVV